MPAKLPQDFLHHKDSGEKLSPVPTEPIKQFSDLIPRWWKAQYGINLDDPKAELMDADGDGTSNLEEYRNGTNPRLSDLVCDEIAKPHKHPVEEKLVRPNDSHLLHHDKNEPEPQE